MLSVIFTSEYPLCLYKVAYTYHVHAEWEALDWDAFQASHAGTTSPFTTPRGEEAGSWVRLPAAPQEADDWTMIDAEEM